MAEKMAECEKNRGRARSIKKRDGRERKKSRGGQIKYYTNLVSRRNTNETRSFSLSLDGQPFSIVHDLFDRPPALIFPSLLRPVPSTRFISSYTFSNLFFFSFPDFFSSPLLFLWYLRTSRIFLLFN